MTTCYVNPAKWPYIDVARFFVRLLHASKNVFTICSERPSVVPGKTATRTETPEWSSDHEDVEYHLAANQGPAVRSTTRFKADADEGDTSPPAIGINDADKLMRMAIASSALLRDDTRRRVESFVEETAGD